MFAVIIFIIIIKSGNHSFFLLSSPGPNKNPMYGINSITLNPFLAGYMQYYQ